MTDLAERQISTQQPEPPTPERPSSRVRIAQALALVGLVGALVGAAGPAERVRTTYSWPPPTLPEGTPERTWYAPLLLIRHRAETIDARVPCRLPAELPGVRGPVTVLATARRPDHIEGLAVRSGAGALTVSLGDELLARAALAEGAGDPACIYELRIADRRWSLSGGPAAVSRGGELDTLPRVTGLFSGLDLRRGGGPTVDVTTFPHRTRTLDRQAVAWALAVLAVVAALLLVAFEHLPRRPWSRAAELVRRGLARAHPADVVVFALLLGWWVLSPVFWDDGWILERTAMYSVSGGFSVYYNGFGANLPLDYWLEWGQHLLVDVSRALLLLRVPALLALAGTWVLCRFVLGELLPSGDPRRGAVPWALAAGFLVGALAWGMTLRPEPVIALLVTVVLAAMLRFSRTETVAPLALTAAVVPLALTGHHSGVASLAPVLVCAPQALRWAKARPAAASTMVTSSIALSLVLLFVGADLTQRRDDAALHRSAAPNWREEFDRYFILSDFPSATPLRRASVALMGLVLVAWLWRRRRAHGSTYPAAVLLASLLLLVATPSKWPWHFGALIGILAVAVATETAVLRGLRDLRWARAVPFAAVAAAVVAGAWAWWPRSAWNAADLRTLEWELGLESWFPLVPLATAVPGILLAFAVALARRNSRPVDAAAFGVASWTAPALAVPLVVFTVGVLVADSVKTSSWTPARQNLGTLRAGAGCGLADALVTADPGSARVLPLVGATAGAAPAWVPPAPVEGVRRYALAPASGRFGASDWHALPQGGRVGLFVSGTPSPTDRLSLEWGRREGARVESIGRDPITVDFVDDSGAGIVTWRLVAAGELPERRAGADAVRVTLSSDDELAAAVAVTSPVRYASRPLAQQLRPADTPSLVNPKLVTYFPCVRQPELRNGAVGVPQHVVASDDLGQIWPLGHEGRSPFTGILDLYSLQHLPLGDSRNPPRDVLVYEVVQTVPGAQLAAPVARTWSS